MTGGEGPAEDDGGAEATLAAAVRAECAAAAPSAEERADALRDRRHHLVRDTESSVTVAPDVGPGVDAEATVTVPDTYCFTYGEWVGLSGLDLTGTPRSREDAYYLDGPPPAARALRRRVGDSVATLAGEVVEEHPDGGGAAEALEFILGEVEQIRGGLEEGD